MIDWTKPVRWMTSNVDPLKVKYVGDNIVVCDSDGDERLFRKETGTGYNGGVTQLVENVPEKPKITPKPGELWSHNATTGVFFISQYHGQLFLTWESSRPTLNREISPFTYIAEMGEPLIHGKGPWTRIYPPVEESDNE